YLIAGGESDELCPLENTKAFAKALGGPKQLIIYADARHSICGVPSATNGPDPRAYQAKWVPVDRSPVSTGSSNPAVGSTRRRWRDQQTIDHIGSLPSDIRS